MNDSLMATVGKRVRQARLMADPSLSQEDIGKVWGMVQSAVSALERGERPTTIQEIERIAAYFDRPPLWFFGDDVQIDVRSLRSTNRDLPPEAAKELVDFVRYVMEKYGKEGK